MALSLNNLGWVAAHTGDYPRAARYHQRGLDPRREVGDQRGIGFALANLCWVECMHGDLERAAGQIEEAWRILEYLEDRVLLSWAPVNRACLARLRGDGVLALELLEEGIALWGRGGGHPTLPARCRCRRLRDKLRARLDFGLGPARVPVATGEGSGGKSIALPGLMPA